MRRRAEWAQPGASPRLGEIMRDFEFTDASGNRQLLSQYRGSSTLLVLIGEKEWIATVGASESRFSKRQVKLLLLGNEANDDASILLALAGGHSAAYFTDRYGEVIYRWKEDEGRARPSLEDLLDWAEHLENRCDECFPSEWPD